MNDSIQKAADVAQNGEFPHDLIFSNLVMRLLDCFAKAGIPARNLVIGVGTKNARLAHEHEKAIQVIWKDLIEKEFHFTLDDQILIRAVKDDFRLAVTDKFYEMCNVLDVLLPRYHHQNLQEKPMAHPLPNEPILTLEEIVGMFINENATYIRRRLGQVCLEQNTSIITRPTDQEVDDMEMAEGAWMVKQDSAEGVALAAALNYSPAELTDANLPRFDFITKAIGPLREIADNSPRQKNPTLAFVTGAANTMFVYMSQQRPDDSDIEAASLLSKYRNFRTNVGWHRDTAISVLSRLNNGKPAYKDLINLAKRYYGIHHWGLDSLIRLTIPLLKPMYDCPLTRPEMIQWIDSCGVLELYKEHKRFHRAHQATK